MSHTFVKPDEVVSMGLGLLQRELLLPGLVNRWSFDDYVGIKNDTLNVKIPAVLSAREYSWRNNRASAITSDNLTEQSIAVTLDKHPYSAVSLTDEELNMDIVNFGEQVLRPQVRAVAEKLESYIATAMENVDAAHGVNYQPATYGFFKAAVGARKALNIENVPTGDRYIILGANVEEAVLNDSTFKVVSNSGSDSVLRNAVIGRVAGFNVIGNVNSVDDDFALAFHSSAFAFINAAPRIPRGAASGATLTDNSFALRWVNDYDQDYMRDRSVIDSFAGAISVEDGRDSSGTLTSKNVRACLIHFASAS